MKCFVFLASFFLSAIGFAMHQNFVIQKNAENDMRTAVSNEAKAMQQVLLQCRLDMMRECESPRFLPPPFLVFDRDIMSIVQPPDIMDAFFDMASPQAVVEPRSSWLIVSSWEPSLGNDKDDRVQRAENDSVTIARRRLSEEEAGTKAQKSVEVPSYCLDKAYRDQRVGRSCANAIHELEKVRQDKANKLIALYEESHFQMQQLVVLYVLAFFDALAFFAMALMFVRARDMRGATQEEYVDETSWADVLLYLVYLLTAFVLYLAAGPFMTLSFAFFGFLFVLPSCFGSAYMEDTCMDDSSQDQQCWSYCNSTGCPCRDSGDLCSGSEACGEHRGARGSHGDGTVYLGTRGGGKISIYEGIPIQIV